jgi:hypothetical protein
MKEAPGSSETSVLTRATRRNNPEDTILQITSKFQPVNMDQEYLLLQLMANYFAPDSFPTHGHGVTSQFGLIVNM